MSAAPSPRLICDNLSKSYASRAGEVQALANVTFSVYEGEFVCLVGPSGCGKSTLLRLLAGLEQPTTGSVGYLGDAPAYGQRSAMVFQEHGLFPWLSVQDNVAFGLETHGIAKTERQSRAQALLAQLGLGAFGRHFPHELSVGMRQRAAIGRALLSDPLLLLMDEPFSALDAQTRRVMQEELLRLWQARQKTVVFVTHDIEEAVLLGDRVLVLSGRPGRVQEVVQVPLPRPRASRDRDQAAVREIAWHIWKNIEGEVRQSLQLAR